MAVASPMFDTQHQDLIHDIQPDFCGKRLATCSSDNSIRIFAVDGDSQRLIQVLKDHSAPVWQVAWSHPQFDNILASCSYDGGVLLWKEVNGSWIKFKEHREHKASVNAISFAPAELGLHLACASSDGRVSVLSYKDQGEWETKSFSAHVSGVNTLCWATTSVPNTPLVKRIVTGGSDNSIKVWTQTGESGEWVEECGSLEGHSDWVRDVAWCPNETLPFLLVASGSQDRTVLLWTSVDGGKSWAKHPLCAPFSDPVWKLSWSIAGNLLAVSYGENKTSVWRQNIDNTWEKIQQIEDGREVSIQ